MQLASTGDGKTIHIDLSEEEAGKLSWILLNMILWDSDPHGLFAKELFSELEAIGVSLPEEG